MDRRLWVVWAPGPWRAVPGQTALSQDDPSPSVTGHMGERVNRRVALMTEDFRLYHRLAPFFEDHGITLLGLRPGEEVPVAVQAILDGPEGDPRSIPLRDDPDACYLAVLHALDPRRGLDEPYRLLRIGIDPGETIGLALLADGAVFHVAEAHGPKDAATRIRAWLQGLSADAVWVHVGDGSPPHAKAIIEALQDIPGLTVSLVQERSSTPTAPVTGSRHTDAAIHIAMREPL